MVENLVPMAEAMRRLNRSRSTLLEWVRKGRLQGHCLGGRLWVFDALSIEQAAIDPPPGPFGRPAKKI